MNGKVYCLKLRHTWFTFNWISSTVYVQYTEYFYTCAATVELYSRVCYKCTYSICIEQQNVFVATVYSVQYAVCMYTCRVPVYSVRYCTVLYVCTPVEKKSIFTVYSHCMYTCISAECLCTIYRMPHVYISAACWCTLYSILYIYLLNGSVVGPGQLYNHLPGLALGYYWQCGLYMLPAALLYRQA